MTELIYQKDSYQKEFEATMARVEGKSVVLDKTIFYPQIIKKDADVKCEEMPREEAFKIPSVLKLKNVLPPSVDMIRIVDIGGLDKQACGGTHVKNTREIGEIKIIKTENKGKNNRRIVFGLVNV